MGIRGLNKRDAANLIEMLDLFERLQDIIVLDPSDKEKIQVFRKEVQETHRKYEELILQVSEQVEVFKSLYNEIRQGFVPEKLKMIRKTVPDDSYEFFILKESIRKSYVF